MYAFGTREAGRHCVASTRSFGIAAAVVLAPRRLTAMGPGERRGLPAGMTVPQWLWPPAAERGVKRFEAARLARSRHQPSRSSSEARHGARNAASLSGGAAASARRAAARSRSPSVHAHRRVEPQAGPWSGPEADRPECVGVRVDEVNADPMEEDDELAAA
jgi:hypothetical protein